MVTDCLLGWLTNQKVLQIIRDLSLSVSRSNSTGNTPSVLAISQFLIPGLKYRYLLSVMRYGSVNDRDKDFRLAGTGIGLFWPGPGPGFPILYSISTLYTLITM